MKTIFRTLALSAAFLSMFTACQREELEQNQEPETPKTHTVTFVADSPETKTTAQIDEENRTVTFAWTAEDVNRIKLYENSTRAGRTQGTLTNGIMTIKAEFEGGVSAGENTYVAVLNSANDLQILYKEAYAEDADILVSKAVTSFNESESILLQFKREVAIAKMTLKGLDPGEVVNHITVSSTADIAGSYGVEGWKSTKTSLDIWSELAMDVPEGYSIVANQSGEAVVWFTCIPQDKSVLTVMVEAADGDTYTKEFGRAITLTRGDVKGFGVAMEKDAKETPSYTIVFNSTINTATEISTSIETSTFVESGAEYLLAQPVTDTKKSYYGGSTSGLPLRVGTANVAGSVTLALSELGKVPATKIVLLAKQYSSDNSKFKVIGVNGLDKQQPGTDYVELSYDLDGTEISSIKLDTDGYIYVKSITVEYGGTIKTKLATPTSLDVSADKVVSWDAVDGAASYILTIGTVVVDLTCETNSYPASEIPDEYYDVAVVAVPSDTENYKNSDAATFPNVKFGNPTLTTPTLQEGTTDATSVSASWTVDTRATAGYNCELYNGESKEGDSKTVNSGAVTFDGLNSGVKYTIKVNAIAVNGVKSYAASSVATIDVLTKEATKTVTYTVKTTSEVTVSGTAPSGSSATYKSTYNNKNQLTGGNNMTLTLSGYEGMVVKGLTLSMRSNSSSGAGYLSVKAGDTSLGAIGSSNSGVKFNDDKWNGAWSQNYVDVTPTLNSYTVKDGENIVIEIGATTSSLYCQSFTIEYVEDNNDTGKLDKLDKPNVTCSARTDNSLTFTWDAVANAKGYKVSTDEGKTYGDLQNTTEYTWTGLKANTEYTLYVMAIGDGTDYDDSDAGSAKGTTSSSSTGEQTLKVDFESELTTFSDWEFNNLSIESSTVAHSGNCYATNGTTKTAYAKTKNKIASPQSIKCYYTKLSGNTNATSYFVVQVSTDGTSWTDVSKGETMSNVTQNKWEELSADLSSYSDVYVRVYYTGTNAKRALDDVELIYK